jgi:hypothetical protein
MDDLLFQEPTTKISDPNSKYYGSIDQNSEARFSSFYMENQKAVTVFFNMLTNVLKV